MWVNCFCPFSAPTAFSVQNLQPSLTLSRNRPLLRKNSSPLTCRLQVGIEDVAAIAQNKVLMAAVLSAAVGQLLKPLTSSLLYGNDFDPKSAFQSGGFPSAHSSTVVAAATSLALERGFSDAIFGVTAIFAVLVMYDAQGVRREVGKHARTINTILVRSQTISSNSSNIGGNEKTTVLEITNLPSSSAAENTNNLSQATEVDHSSSGSVLLTTMDQRSNAEETTRYAGQVAGENGSEENVSKDSYRLYERVGHTEVEVIAGALLGAVVSLAVHSLA